MNILKPNNGQDVQYIVSSHVYIKVWDYGKKHILFHLKVKNSHVSAVDSVWAWMDLTEGAVTNIFESNYSSFEDAINRSVNNPYCTVYQFDSYEEMAIHWEDLRYLDQIQTIYKGDSDV